MATSQSSTADDGTAGIHQDLLDVVNQLTRPVLLFGHAPRSGRLIMLCANPAAETCFGWARPNERWPNGAPDSVRGLVERSLKESRALADELSDLDENASRFKVETAVVRGRIVMVTMDRIHTNRSQLAINRLMLGLLDDIEGVVAVCRLRPGTDLLDAQVLIGSAGFRRMATGRRPGGHSLRDITEALFTTSALDHLKALQGKPGRVVWRANSGARAWRCIAQSVEGYIAFAFEDLSEAARLMETVTAQAQLLAAARHDGLYVQAALSKVVDVLLPMQAELNRTAHDALMQGQYTHAVDATASSADLNEQVRGLLSSLATFHRIADSATTNATVHLDEIADAVVAQESESIGPTDISIERGRLPVIWGSEALLALMLRHLIRNAIQARRRDAPNQIRISSERIDGGWRLYVDDTGVGMSFVDRNAAFDPLHAMPFRKNPGSGFGLAICRRIAELHGGAIGIDEKDGAGCRVWVDLRSK